MKKCLDFCAEVLGILSAICFLGIFAVNVGNIFCRSLLGFSLLWSSDFSMLLCPWTMCLAMAVAVYHHDHLIVTFLVDLMPAKARNSLKVFTRILLFGLCVLLLYEGIVVTQLRVGILYVTLRWSTALAYAALPVFALFSCLFLLYNLSLDVKNLTSSKGGAA